VKARKVLVHFITNKGVAATNSICAILTWKLRLGIGDWGLGSVVRRPLFIVIGVSRSCGLI